MRDHISGLGVEHLVHWENVQLIVAGICRNKKKNDLQNHNSRLWKPKSNGCVHGLIWPFEVPHLQCTTMGRFPDCCCCLCTAAIMSIIPLPSPGIPISGHPWKWKCRTCCDRFSWGKFTGYIVFPSYVMIKWDLMYITAKHDALVCLWGPYLCGWRFHTVFPPLAPRCNLQMLYCPLMANTGNTFPGRIKYI